jgi:hypothetical protein
VKKKSTETPAKKPKKHFAAPTEEIWILVDADNSNQNSKNYLRWFETRALARAFLAHNRRNPQHATLIGPYRFRADPAEYPFLRRGSPGRR